MQDSTTCGKTRIHMDEAKTREAYITNNNKKETKKFKRTTDEEQIESSRF